MQAALTSGWYAAWLTPALTPAQAGMRPVVHARWHTLSDRRPAGPPPAQAAGRAGHHLHSAVCQMTAAAQCPMIAPLVATDAPPPKRQPRRCQQSPRMHLGMQSSPAGSATWPPLVTTPCAQAAPALVRRHCAPNSALLEQASQQAPRKCS